MSRFDRKVERTKREYQFTPKKVEEKKETFSGIFKENFTLKWLRFNLQTIIGCILDFMIVTLIVIPFLMGYLDSIFAFVLGHAIFTSLLIVITVYIVNKEKPKLLGFLVRYVFTALLLGAASYLSIVLTSWLGK